MSEQAQELFRSSSRTEMGKCTENVRGGYPERIVPDETAIGVISWHLKKYEFSGEVCRNKVVLDAGCGVGYGAFWLSQFAKSVTGVDISSTAIAYANHRYRNPNIQFIQANLSALPFPEESFDAVCAFEVIEHLPEVTRFLREAKRVLRESGILVASTPHVKATTTQPQNPHHHAEYSLADFRGLLSSFFARVDMFGQRRVQSNLHYYLQKADIFKVRTWGVPRFLRKRACQVLRTTPVEDLSLKDFEIGETMLSRATELVAVCSLPLKFSG